MDERSQYFLPDDLINDPNSPQRNRRLINFNSSFDDHERIGSILAGIGLDEDLPEPELAPTNNHRDPNVEAAHPFPQPVPSLFPSDLRATARSYIPPSSTPSLNILHTHELNGFANPQSLGRPRSGSTSNVPSSTNSHLLGFDVNSSHVLPSPSHRWRDPPATSPNHVTCSLDTDHFSASTVDTASPSRFSPVASGDFHGFGGGLFGGGSAKTSPVRPLQSPLIHTPPLHTSPSAGFPQDTGFGLQPQGLPSPSATTHSNPHSPSLAQQERSPFAASSRDTFFPRPRASSNCESRSPTTTEWHPANNKKYTDDEATGDKPMKWTNVIQQSTPPRNVANPHAEMVLPVSPNPRVGVRPGQPTKRQPTKQPAPGEKGTAKHNPASKKSVVRQTQAKHQPAKESASTPSPVVQPINKSNNKETREKPRTSTKNKQVKKTTPSPAAKAKKADPPEFRKWDNLARPSMENHHETAQQQGPKGSLDIVEPFVNEEGPPKSTKLDKERDEAVNKLLLRADESEKNLLLSADESEKDLLQEGTADVRSGEPVAEAEKQPKSIPAAETTVNHARTKKEPPKTNNKHHVAQTRATHTRTKQRKQSDVQGGRSQKRPQRQAHPPPVAATASSQTRSSTSLGDVSNAALQVISGVGSSASDQGVAMMQSMMEVSKTVWRHFNTVHELAFEVMSLNYQVGVCYSFLYAFPLILEMVIPWAPPWAPGCLWYAFLIQLLCGDSNAHANFYRVMIPMMFAIEGLSERSILMDLKGCELLIAAFILSLLSLNRPFTPLVVLSFSIQVILSSPAIPGTPLSISLHWVVLLVGLLTLNADQLQARYLSNEYRGVRK